MQASESTQLMFSGDFNGQLNSNFHSIVIFDGNVEIHKVRRLVFDNDKRCAVSLNPVLHCLARKQIN